MSRALVTLLAAAALLAIPRPAHGFTVIVPDEVPTVQQAVAGTADTIVVRATAPVESVDVLRPLALLAFEDPALLRGEMPSLGALAVGPGASGTLLVRGFRIERGVRSAATLADDLRLRLEHCRVEAGGVQLATSGYASRFAMLGCIVHGDVTGRPYGAWLEVNTVFGRVEFTHHESDVQLLGNTVLGPAAVGIGLYDCDGTTVVRGNEVSGCEQGIDVTAGSDTWITDNLVERCDEGGIRVNRPSGAPFASAHVERNRIRETGSGLLLTSGAYTVRDNVVSDVAGDGLRMTGGMQGLVTGNLVERAGGHGAMVLVPDLAEFARNTLVDCEEGGAELEMVARADSNVIADCGAFGLRVQAPAAQLLVRLNTLRANHGPGLDLGGGAGDTLRGNLSAGNEGAGLLWRGVKAPVMMCNDWWSNAGGPTSGVSPGPSDLELNPLFCDAAAHDLRLSAISPLLALACGPVGALGVGCTEPVAVGPVPPGDTGLHLVRRGANPGPGPLVFSAAMPREGAVTLSIVDVAGRQWFRRTWDRLAAGEHVLTAPESGRWPDGVYFARLQSGDQRATVRLALRR